MLVELYAFLLAVMQKGMDGPLRGNIYLNMLVVKVY